MTIFPPFKKQTVLINDAENFGLYLKNKIEYGNTNRSATLAGKLNETGFLVEIKDSRFNRHPPLIKGTIESHSNGKKYLTIGVQSRKTGFYIFIFFSFFILIVSLIQAKPWFLLSIPIMAAWIWIWFLILHLAGIDKTKVEVREIIKKAQGDS